jgi:hypothetical protein
MKTIIQIIYFTKVRMILLLLLLLAFITLQEFPPPSPNHSTYHDLAQSPSNPALQDLPNPKE